MLIKSAQHSFHDICINLDLEDDFMNMRRIDYNVFQDKMESYANENWKLTVKDTCYLWGKK